MNIFAVVNLSDDSDERLTDGGLENWTGGVLDSWDKNELGASTVNQSTNLRPGTTGSYSVRIDIDSSNNTGGIRQTISLIPGIRYKISFWYKNSAANKTARIILRDDMQVVFLNENLEWQETEAYIPLKNFTFWRYVEFEFTAKELYSSYLFRFLNDSAASSSIYLDDVSITRQDTFAAISPTTVTFNGDTVQSEKVITEISPISTRVGEDGAYESSGLTLSLQDNDGYFSGIYDSANKSIKGRRVDIYSAAGVKINQYHIHSINLRLNAFDLICSDQWDEFGENKTPWVITENEFPDGSVTSYGKAIPVFFGNFTEPPSAAYIGENTIRCYNTYQNASTNYHILGLAGSSVVSLQNAFDPNGTDRTATCSLISPTATDPYYYIQCTNPYEYLDVNVVYNTIDFDDMIAEIGETLFENLAFDTSRIDGLLISGSGLSGRNYAPFHYAVTERTSRADILREFCNCVAMEYYIKNGYIVFNVIEYSSFIEDYFLQPGEIISIEPIPVDYSKAPNRINISTPYDHPSNSYKSYGVYDDKESQIINAVTEKGLNFKIGVYVQEHTGDMFGPAVFTAKHMSIIRRYGEKKVILRIPAESETGTAGLDINPFTVLGIKHDIFEDSEKHLLYVRSVEHDPASGLTTLETWDLTHLSAEVPAPGLTVNYECFFHLLSNTNDGSKHFYDISPQGHTQIINYAGNLEHDTANTLYGSSSINFPGTTNNFLYTVPSTRNLQFAIFSDLSESDYSAVTLITWIKFDTISTRNDTICGQYINANNYWRFRRETNNRLSLLIRYGGVNVLNISPTATIANTNWHHIILFRTNAALAIYIDGAQVIYNTTTLDYTFNASFRIGYDQSSTTYLDARMESMKVDWILAQNWHDLAPNAGLTDTYEVPTGMYSMMYRKYFG